MELTPKIIYSAYLRKSSEDSNRQILSIPAQKSELEKLALSKDIKISYQFSESRSAKDPGRKEFSELCTLIAEGKTQGIICWKLDRLARNTVDGGLLQHFLHRGLLKEIVTPEKTYYAADSTFMTAFEFANSTQFVRDLSVNVKRGLRKRLELKKIPTGLATIGFINDKTKDKGDRDWLVDQDRFPIIKQMFEMYLSGNYSGADIHKWLIQEAKLTTPLRRSFGGKLVSCAHTYWMLKNPIYAGFFYDKGERHELHESLPRIITEDQHHKILRMLGSKHTPKTQLHHNVIYSGYVISPEGEYVGPDVKLQIICQCKYKFSYTHKTHCPKCGIDINKIVNPKYLSYIFYRNIAKSKRKEKVKYIEEGELTKEFLSYAEENLLLSKPFMEWGKKYFRELQDKELQKAHLLQSNQSTRLKQLELKKEKYRDMYSDGLTTRDEYINDVAKLEQEIAELKHHKAESSDWLDKADEILSLGEELKNVLESKNTKAIRSVLNRLGSNLTWDEEKVGFVNKEAVQLLIDGLNEAKAKKKEFEPKNIFDLSEQNEIFRTVRPILLPR